VGLADKPSKLGLVENCFKRLVFAYHDINSI